MRSSQAHAARSRRTTIIVRTAFVTYLRAYLPPAPWALAGHEVPLGRLRADFQWRHPDGAHFFDELKTEPFTLLLHDVAAHEQVAGYFEGGQGLPGQFLGIRLISLGVPSGLLTLHASEARMPGAEETER